MASSTVWGLDIGNSAIKAVKMVRTSDGCMVARFDIINIPVVDEDKDRPKRVEAALATLVSNNRFGGDPVYVAVAGNLCLHREFQLPPGSEDKLADLVQYEAKQQIPFPLDQVEWGFERFDDPNGVGVALMAVRKNDIQDLLALTEKFRLNLRGITPSALALFNFVQYEFKPDGTTLILDAGAKGIDFVVMNKRQIYFRTIQIAGREITRVLENKFKVSYDKAEELKRNIAKSAQAEKIMSVIEPTLRQLGAEVQRTIGFYKSKARGQRIQQCYLLGHTFRLPKIADFLQGQVREAPFALVEGLQRVKLDGSINAEVWNSEFPTMAVAIGLGVQGLGVSELTLNLIPQTKKSELARAKWKGWMAASAALVLAALWVSYTEAGKAETKFQDKLQELQADLENVNRYQKDETNAVAGLPEKKVLLERFARIGHDCGKIAHTLPKLAGLQGEDGKPFFGPERKIYLTGMYVSRRPPGTRDGRQESVEREVEKSEALSGAHGLYALLNNPKAADPATLPAELRP
ncbi:MAG: pilus assembly protein PilM, partial [Planctomycetota bacterium]|nr:pilus assembly protein PilM [Planctomycetota bacterium]